MNAAPFPDVVVERWYGMNVIYHLPRIDPRRMLHVVEGGRSWAEKILKHFHCFAHAAPPYVAFDAWAYATVLYELFLNVQDWTAELAKEHPRWC